MPRYLVRCVLGASRPGEAWREFGGISGSLTVETDSRPSAYAWLYKRFKRPGQDVKVTPRYGASGRESQEGQLLGFSEQELKAVRELGVPIEAGYPKDGVQIEEIISLE
jgi:hypothetical protein